MDPIRIQMPQEMFTPAAFKHYEEDVKVDFIKLGGDLFEFLEPLHWEADVTNTGDALLVTGTVEGDARGSCSRCLKGVDFPVTGEIEGFFLINPEADRPEDLEDDEFDYLPEDKVIDMAPLIHSALLLEMPRVLLCDDDCKGLCPICGTNLNDGSCDCKREQDDDEEPGGSSSNPFAVLKDVDFD